MYFEEKKHGNKYRQAYLDTLNSLIEKRQSYADEEREINFRNMIKNREAYRKEFRKMLGWPLTEENCEIPTGTKEFVINEEGISIYRVQIDILDGLKFYGILFVHDIDEQLPLVIVQHGGQGTPELCAGFFDDGTANYNDIIRRTLKYKTNVFAPQLLLWDKETYNIDYDRATIDARLKQLGSSITAIEVYAISKSIDYLSVLGYVHDGQLGMLGLSYGGFYTLYTAAADTRIKAAIACSQYNNRYKYSWTDWTWLNAGFQFLDNEVAMLVYPRYLCIEIGDQDELFDAELGKAEFQKLIQMTDNDTWLDFRVFPGKHEFFQKDHDIKKLVEKIRVE